MMTNERKITHTYGWQLSKGMKRQSNQDSLAVAKMRQVSEDNSYSMGIYIVADGVAGGPDGDEASKIATDVAMRDVFNNAELLITDENYRQQMLHAAELAHLSIREHHESAATTFVMAVVIQTKIYVLNIGDSRAYVLSDGALRKITKDHTFVQELLDNGILTEEEAENHPRRNLLLRSLGAEAEIEPDIFSEDLNVGDYLLLCSDGLYNLVDEATITRTILESDDPQSATQQLTELANNAGGNDNIAVIVVRIKARDS